MIKQIRFKNFLSHKDTVIPLLPGVNAIAGKSDSGKSAIFHGLRWLIENKPSGDSFRSHWGGDTMVEVTLFNDTVVQRIRTDKDNLYVVNGKELRAFGQGDPPKEVQQALNIGDVNVQAQMDAPFLLGNSGGDVARYLNRIVSLDVIDSSLANINKEVAETKRSLVSTQASVKQKEEELLQYEHLGQMELLCEEAERLELLCDKTENRVSTLTNLMNGHRQTRVMQHKADGIVVGLGGMVYWVELFFCKEQEISNKVLSLERILTNIGNYCQMLDELPDTTGFDDAYANTQKLINEQSALDKECQKLQSLLDSARTIGNYIVKMEKDVVDLQEEFNNLMPNVCPLCGQEVTKCEPSRHRQKKRST